MTMVQALNSAMDVLLARDPDVVIFGEDVGFYGGVFRVTEGLQQKHGEHARVRHADRRGRHDGGRGRHGRLRAAAGRRDPVRRLHLSGDRPARLRGGAAALPLGRRVLGADHGARALRRRHLRRPDAQPERRGDLHPCLRPEDGDPVQPVRRQGSADQRRSRTTTRSSSSSRSGSITARSTAIPTGRRCRGRGTSWPRCPTGYYTVPLGKAAVVRDGRGGHRAGLRHDGACRAGRRRGNRHRRRNHRPAHAVAARHRYDRRLRSRRPAAASIAHEATRTCGFGAELSALVQEHCFYHLEAPIVRVTGWDTPYPHALEWDYFPGPARLADGMRRALEG